jgi:hypothetical protein
VHSSRTRRATTKPSDADYEVPGSSSCDEGGDSDDEDEQFEELSDGGEAADAADGLVELADAARQDDQQRQPAKTKEKYTDAR